MPQFSYGQSPNMRGGISDEKIVIRWGPSLAEVHSEVVALECATARGFGYAQCLLDTRLVLCGKAPLPERRFR